MTDRILVTRPEPGLTETLRHLAERGREGLPAPCLEISPRRIAANGLGRCQAILVTSRNALPALPACLRHLLLLAVGDATASGARDMGFARVHSADGDASSLRVLAREVLRPGDGALLLASGARQGHAVAGALREAGFAVMRRVAYGAVPASSLPTAALAAIQDRMVRETLFFSAETAAIFARLLPRPLCGVLGSVAALCLSDAVARAAAALPWGEIRVAVRPTQADLLALL